MKTYTLIQLLAVAGLVIGLGLPDVAFAATGSCQLPVSEHETTGVFRIDGNCPDVDCDDAEDDCELVQLVMSIPQTIGCMCGADGADCVMAYSGTIQYDQNGDPFGQGGSIYCYANDCSTGCPAPTVGGPAVNGWRAATCPACG